MKKEAPTTPERFDCIQNCERRSGILEDAANKLNTTEWYRTKLTNISLVIRTHRMDESLQAVLGERKLLPEDGNPFTTETGSEILSCRQSPDCQADCPLPEAAQVRQAVVDEAVDIMINNGW